MNKKILLSALAIVFLVACSPEQGPASHSDYSLNVVDKMQGFLGDTPDPSQFVVGLSHLNVIVEDIEYAAEFYQRTLGFEQAYNERGIMDYPSVTRASFARNAGYLDGKVDVHVRFLRHPTAGIYIELMTYRHPVGSADIIFRNANDMGGIRHTALVVSDAVKVWEFLKEQPDVRMINESPDYGPPEELTPTPIAL